MASGPPKLLCSEGGQSLLGLRGRIPRKAHTCIPQLVCSEKNTDGFATDKFLFIFCGWVGSK